MKEDIDLLLGDLTTLSKNETLLNTTKEDLLVACTFSSEREAANGALMESLLKYAEDMHVYKEDGRPYHKTIVNILMELMFNNLKHNILSKDHPANLTIQKAGEHFIIKITTVGTKEKYMKLNQSTTLNEVSKEDSRTIHTHTLSNNKDVDENGCGGMGHQVTIRRIKRLFPDAKDIFHVSDPINLDNNMVRSELTVRIPVLKKENAIYEKAPEYAEC